MPMHLPRLALKLVSDLTSMPWHMKGRYAPLSEVVSRVGCTKVLSQSSELKGDCVQCLSVHALTTCGAELYKAQRALLSSCLARPVRTGAPNRG